MDFYVFKDFEIQGILIGYTYLEWTRSYNDLGSFEVSFIYKQELYNILEINNIIYKKDIKEACVILEKYIYADENGEITLKIKGKSLIYFLSYRLFSFTGNINLYNFILNLINENFINPLNQNRKIDNFKIKDLPEDLKNISLSNLDYKKEEVFKAISEQLKTYGYGFKLNYLVKEKMFEFEVYKGINTGCIFSFDFNNISEYEYFLNENSEKNTVLQDNGEFLNENNKGIRRKETNSNEIKKDENVSFVVLDKNAQYDYLIDWNLGDIVNSSNKMLKVSIKKQIIEITEFIEPGGTHITVKIK